MEEQNALMELLMKEKLSHHERLLSDEIMRRFTTPHRPPQIETRPGPVIPELLLGQPEEF